MVAIESSAVMATRPAAQRHPPAEDLAERRGRRARGAHEADEQHDLDRRLEGRKQEDWQRERRHGGEQKQQEARCDGGDRRV